MVTINNRSDKHLQIDYLAPFNAASPPTITENARQDAKNWDYTLSSTNATSTTFNITNDSAADTDIIIAGEIFNPAGTVNVRNVGGGGGDILGTGANAFIQSRDMRLFADTGSVGTANNRVNVRIPLGFEGPTGLTTVSGHSGVYLDVNWGGFTAFGSLTLTNISSTAGDVDLRVHDAWAPTSFCGCVQLGDVKQISGEVKLGNISAGGDIRINVGDVMENAGGFAISTDVIITGNVHADARVTINVLSGDVVNGGGVISGHDIVINSQNNGQVGEGDLFIVANVDGGEINAIAKGNIFVTQTVGSMGVGSITSLTGNVTLSSAGGIFDTHGDLGSDVNGNNITINALGNIGSFGNDLDIDSGFSGAGVVNASSLFGSIDLHETLGDLPVGLVAALGHANLTAAGSILDARDAGVNVSAASSILIAGAALGIARDPGLDAGFSINAVIISGATIGTAADALDTDVGALEASAVDGIWIDNSARCHDRRVERSGRHVDTVRADRAQQSGLDPGDRGCGHRQRRRHFGALDSAGAGQDLCDRRRRTRVGGRRGHPGAGDDFLLEDGSEIFAG